MLAVKGKRPPRENVHEHDASADTEERIQREGGKVQKERCGKNACKSEATEREEGANGAHWNTHGFRERGAHARELRAGTFARPRAGARLEKFAHATIVA